MLTRALFAHNCSSLYLTISINIINNIIIITTVSHSASTLPSFGAHTAFCSGGRNRFFSEGRWASNAEISGSWFARLTSEA